MCRVLPGRSSDTHSNKTLEEGYDSRRVGKDEVGRGQQIVIFNPDQVLPCYIIRWT